jgi:hypothetical protein
MAKQESEVDRQLRERAQPLIDLFKRRGSDKLFGERVKRTLLVISEASKRLQEVVECVDLCGLDREQVHMMNEYLNTSADRDLKKLVLGLQQCDSELLDLTIGLEAFTGVRAERRKGQHGRKYVSETQQFIGIFEQVTGKKVVFPKGLGKIVGRHLNSIEFIHQCLHQIDTAIDRKKTITCIRNALAENKAVQTAIDELLAPQVID